MEEQEELLTTEPSFQPLVGFFETGSYSVGQLAWSSRCKPGRSGTRGASASEVLELQAGYGAWLAC